MGARRRASIFARAGIVPTTHRQMTFSEQCSESTLNEPIAAPLGIFRQLILSHDPFTVRPLGADGCFGAETKNPGRGCGIQIQHYLDFPGNSRLGWPPLFERHLRHYREEK
jgi:hypothetical protein